MNEMKLTVPSRRSAIFLDRDGVVNALVFNPATSEYESPHWPGDLCVLARVPEALRILQDLGYLLFLVSNQPSYAKGKTTMENIHAIHGLLDRRLQEEGILFTRYYYCYHHPHGVVPELTGACECRKPGTKFITEAVKEFHIDRETSYFIGDQDTDIECGQKAHLKTILVENEHSRLKRGRSSPDYVANSLYGAVEVVRKSKGGVR